ncbi:TonB-dependent receptor [Psychroserpens sp. MEBiC05023]
MKNLLFLFVLISFFGCSKDDSSNVEPQIQDPNATIADNVVVVLEESSELISSESELNNGIYKIQFNQVVPEIEINDILVGNEGLGFLRKVTSISNSDNIITMQTSQANMEDVFGNANINFTADLSGLNRLSSGGYSEKLNYEYFAEGVQRRNDFALGFTNVLINSNASANLRLIDGSLSFNPNYNFDLDYNLFSLDRFAFGMDNAQLITDATFQISSNGETSLPITDYTLYENSKTFIRFVGNVPVVITVFLKLKAKTDLTIDGNLSLTKKLEHNSTLSLGAEYENSNWSPFAELDTEFINHPIDLQGTYVNITDNISLVPEIIIAFYGINGPLIEPTFSGNLGLNISPTQDWDAFLNGKIDLKLGASIGILGETLLSLPFDSYNLFEQPIWNAPETIEIISGNNQIGNQSEQLAEPIKVRVSDNSGLLYLKDVPVYFNVTSGDGTVNEEIVLTDDDGYAEVFWTLGNNIDQQTIEVIVKKADGNNIENTATFYASTQENEVDLSGTWSLSFSATNCSTTPDFNNVGSVTFSFNDDNTISVNNFDYDEILNNTYSLNGNTIYLSYHSSKDYPFSCTDDDGNTVDSYVDVSHQFLAQIEVVNNSFSGDLIYSEANTLPGNACSDPSAVHSFSCQGIINASRQ